MNILTLNIGSSTIKYARFDYDTLEEIERKTEPLTNETQINIILSRIPKPDYIAHRIVHGGHIFTQTTVLNASALEALEKFIPFAPLHQPHNLEGVSIAQNFFPDSLQFGCFDTAFHAGLGDLHSRFALPHFLREQGLKRYGFHGLSYQWVAWHYPQGKIIAAHLGSGASLCALHNGKSIDTSMGLTALDGLPMATRCGTLDAGLVAYLFQNGLYSAKDIETLLYKESGLKGLSGISGDMRVLLDSPDPRAKFAIDYFTLKTAQGISAMAVSLGGVDKIVFTGGIGENAASVRDSIIHQVKSVLPLFSVDVLAANEEKMMAIEVREATHHA